MQKKWMLLITSVILSIQLSAEDIDTSRVVNLSEITVISTPKESGNMLKLPSSVSLIDEQQMMDQRVSSLKNISSIVPNFFIPDYGSRLTSAVYIRGVGSRINTPAVGLYVDNIPYVDKSAFDFNFYDIERVDVLRGAQGTLYGRNTMGGLVKVHTKNPFSGNGTDVKLSVSNRDAHRHLSLTHYHRISDIFAFSAGGYYEGSDGFFRNDYLGKKIDKMQAGGGRIRGIWMPAERLKIDYSLSYDYSDEGAYPYFYTGTLQGVETYPSMVGQISNNRENRYRRGLFNGGLNVEFVADTWLMNAVTGYQNLNDRMFLDQDFLTPDIYTLEQRQRINTLTEEIIFRNKRTSTFEIPRFEWVGGVNIMHQWLHTEAPVTFYNDGLRWLESNVNRVMPDVSTISMLNMMGFTGMGINFRGDHLTMGNNFKTPVLGLASFFQATYHISDKLSATAGIRLDYERMKMEYNAPADVDYGFSMPNPTNPKMAVDLQDLSSHLRMYQGIVRNDYTRLLPKLAFQYHFDADNSLYLSFSEGQRSGGYNLQMFSDLLQGALRVDMMDGIKAGVTNYLQELAATTPTMPSFVPGLVSGIMDEQMPKFPTPTTDQVVYRPEYSWNYEVGTHLSLIDHTLQLDASAFLMLTYDQQIARFADSGLGRKMVNAGRSRSYGAETSLRWTPSDHLAFSGNYGYTHSTFTDYDGGNGENYTGNYIPYVPMHTAHVDAAYSWTPRVSWLQRITFGLNATGAGRIYWTESNSKSQAFYAILGARLVFETNRLNVMFWTRNLMDHRYNTFYFESVGRGFEQHGKPFQMGIDLKLNI